MMSDKYGYQVVWSEESQEYVGLCAEFPNLSWLAKTQESVFKGIRKLVSDTIKDLKSNKEPIPEPLSTKQFSGKFMVRIPPELHRELALEANESHMSLNRYISLKLASRNTIISQASREK